MPTPAQSIPSHAPEKFGWIVLIILFGLAPDFSFTQTVNPSQNQSAPTHILTISGKIVDSGTNEGLSGATIISPTHQLGTLSDENGDFSLSLPSSPASLITKIPGYQTDTLIFPQTPNPPSFFTISLTEKSILLGTVDISDIRSSLSQNQMSFNSLSIDRVKSLPVFMGEVDVLKTLQLLPGVQSGSEASAGIYVRGGGPDQNLILFDDAPLYNVSHLFGFFSIFNGDAVEGVELYKGAFPARYGGRLSSVVNVKPRKGDFNEWGVKGGIGLISSRLAVEGPIIKEKLSFLVAGRRTYVDVFTRQINKWNEDTEDYQEIPDYYFHDLNGRLDWKIGKRDQLSLSGYSGKDDFGYNSGNYSLNFKWRNRTSTLAWDHVFSKNALLHASVVYNRFNYDIEDRYITHRVNVYSDIRDISANVSLTWQPHPRHLIEMGMSHTRHVFQPRGFTGELNYATEDLVGGETLRNHENGVYISDNIGLGDKSQLSLGFRLSSQWLADTAFINPEPRLALLHRLNENITLKGSYTRMAQYLHLVSNSSIALPTDIWYPSTAVAVPEISDQVALGMTSVFGNNRYEYSMELFAKNSQNLVEYKEGTQFLFSDNLDQDMTFGRGWSYGMEFFLQKRLGAFSGWAGYTLSWSFRQFDQINRGEIYPSKFDRRHDISLVASWKLSSKISLSGTWVMGTGSRMTVPLGRYFLSELEELDPEFIPEYSQRNQYRMPTYHRLDLGCTWHLNPAKNHSQLTFNIYNAYNRLNTFFIYYDEVKDENGFVLRYQAKKVSLFPILPSITYNFTF